MLKKKSCSHCIVLWLCTGDILEHNSLSDEHTLQRNTSLTAFISVWLLSWAYSIYWTTPNSFLKKYFKMFYLYFVYIVSNSAVLTFSTEDKGFIVIIILFLFLLILTILFYLNLFCMVFSFSVFHFVSPLWFVRTSSGPHISLFKIYVFYTDVSH